MITVKELSLKLGKVNCNKEDLTKDGPKMLSYLEKLEKNYGDIILVRHFKGKFYVVLDIIEHTETGESIVMYQALYGDFKKYGRPLDMFMSRVDKIKYPELKQEYRFGLVELN